MTKVSIIGGGSFGSAISILMAKKGYDVCLWDRDKFVIAEINKKRTNDKYIKDITFPSNVKAYEDLPPCVENSQFIILAVPSNAIRGICKSIKGIVNSSQIIVSIAKGIEGVSLKRISEVIKEELSSNPVVILSGPSHAEEVALEIPTTVVVTCEAMFYAEKVQELFTAPKFRVYTNDDIIGVEIGGAVKNIIALAAGISDGIGYGDNTKAALMTRGMSEIMRIGTLLGGKKETFFGLTGMGDLIVTCTSMHSRNRRAGILIGQGFSPEEATTKVGMVVEGISACKAFYELKEKCDISMPITDILYKVLFKGKNPKEAVSELMSRDKKDETY